MFKYVWLDLEMILAYNTKVVVTERAPAISRPPVFSLPALYIAKDFAKEFTSAHFKEAEYENFDALKLAVALSWYNYVLSEDGLQSARQTQIKLSNLITEEREASSPFNPLPTIGIEIESPNKPLRMKPVLFDEYARFFDKIGMPRNKINKSFVEFFDGDPSYWEFSPPPSFSARVQSTIISQLIRGNFVPHLQDSQDPDDIKKYLSNKLVSLHINLGIPPKVGLKYGYQLYSNRDLNIFVSSFAVGFTSPKRLECRQNKKSFFKIRVGTQTPKSLWSPGRIEVVSMEMRDQSAYRALRQIQLVAVALFAHLENPNSAFGRIWQEAELELFYLYTGTGYISETDELKDNNTVKQMARDKKVVDATRAILNRQALKVSAFIAKQKTAA